MILDERMIEHYVYQHGMISDPIIPGKRSKIGISRGLSSCGYDFGLGYDLKKFRGNIITPLGDKNDEDWVDMESDPALNNTMKCLNPGDLVLGSSIEYIKMPKNLFGIAHLKSCWARTGLTMSLGALQPGWEGRIIFEFVNPTRTIIGLIPGEGIVHVVFYELGNMVNGYDGFAQGQLGTEIRHPKDVINK